MPDQHFQLLALNDCSIGRIDAALNRLTQTALPCKKLLLNASAHTILADGKARTAELELLRAMADTLDCPVPPLVG